MAPVLTLAILTLLTESEYHFSTATAAVSINVNFLPAFVGQRPVLYSGSREIPLPGLDAKQFVGAGALVQYKVRATGGGRRKPGVVRERVVLVGQSDGLPARPDFDKTVPLVQGVASDLQLFGYDESTLAVGERPAARQQGLWRRFRQELYLGQDTEPFAVLEWTHTLTEIRLEAANPFPGKQSAR